MKKETGGPAFPQVVYNMKGGYDTTGGMSLRDYLAAKAMQGWVAASPKIMGEPLDGTVEMAEVVSLAAYVLADAMLKERELKEREK